MPSYSMATGDTAPMEVRLSWDVVDLLRRGQEQEATAVLAAQRRVGPQEARRLVAAWRRQRRLQAAGAVETTGSEEEAG